jgi:RHH-type proline utilization regulon transcriptional repressor/proline dehydrogenase/delta 1-pyrroline-5-carboxylate dehydrogenase
MGGELYEEVVPRQGIPCRIYAPVGSHEDLLPYLVRRLLENGANSSFVNRIVDEKAPIQSLIEDPTSKALSLLAKMHQNIPLPASLFMPQRQNSQGLDLSDRAVLASLQAYYTEKELPPLEAKPLLGGNRVGGEVQKNIFSPENTQWCIGKVTEASLEDVDFALQQAKVAFVAWNATPVQERAKPILAYADLLERHRE